MKMIKKVALILSMSLGVITQAQATHLPLNADGNWNEFIVDDYSAISQTTEWIDANDSNSSDFGSPLHFTFNITTGFTGFLSIVDAGFSGDRFEIFNHGKSIGLTSVTNNDNDISNNFSGNLTNLHFSSGTFILIAGTYDITGTLFSTLQSFNATNGAIKLETVQASHLPEPTTYLLLLSGFFSLFIARRRA